MARHAAVLLALAAFTLLAQPTKPAPTFDVASIHQTDRSAPPTPCFMRGQAGGQTYTGRCIALSVIIKRAYQIVDSQLSGGPDWLNTTLFDFDAKTDRPTTRADVEPLFQSFLAGRFNLKMHTEQRTMQALVLTVDGAGNKMTPNTTDYEWEIPIQGAGGPIPKVKGIRCPMSYFSWYIGQKAEPPSGRSHRTQRLLGLHPRVRPRRHVGAQGAGWRDTPPARRSQYLHRPSRTARTEDAIPKDPRGRIHHRPRGQADRQLADA